MKKLLDLRFVIGLFFSIVGALLIMYGVMFSAGNNNQFTINFYCGLLMMVFGLMMIILSGKKKREINHT